MAKMVLIEFTTDTFVKNENGFDVPKRSKGDVVKVDQMSARSLVDVKKVARRVEDPVPQAVTAPAPAPVITPEPLSDADEDDDAPA